MSCVVVLGPHRSGTSLVASILNSIGVNMGDRFRLADEFNPTGYCEDLDFKELNQAMLKYCGCTWHEPPSQEQLAGACVHFEKDMHRLLFRKCTQQEHIRREYMWGWKDPRQCLVMGCYDYWLYQMERDVKYVVVERNVDAIVSSLMHREQVKARRTERPTMYWKLLTNYYYARIESLVIGSFSSPLAVNYDLLVCDRELAWAIVDGICRFVGVFPSDELVAGAVKMIMFKGEQDDGEEGQPPSRRWAGTPV